MKHPDPRIEALLHKLASPTLGAIDLSLDRIRALMETLGNPQARLPPVLHIAGTNGKGSLCAYLTAIFQAAGYRVHRYISPHLIRFNERVMLAGQDITDAQLLPLLQRLDAVCARQPVTFFEATTALAYLAFAETPADIVLLETGLGGRLDATNILEAPALTAITPISIDHTEYLGPTLALIAAEKAAIIKHKVPCVAGPQHSEAAPILEQAAIRQEALLYRYRRDWDVERRQDKLHYHSHKRDAYFPLPGLTGEHQIANAGTAIACVDQLAGFVIDHEHIALGLEQVQWPGRLQRLQNGSLVKLLPESAQLWLDGGHNPDAGQVLAGWISVQNLPVHVICGMLQKKDTLAFLEPMTPYMASFTAIEIPDEANGQTPQTLMDSALHAGMSAQNIGMSQNIKNAIESIEKKQENKKFSILICGSLYLVGNILWQNARGL